MTTEHDLVDLAHRASTPSKLGDSALAVLCDALEADLGIFVTTEAEREVRALRGLEGEELHIVESGWRHAQKDLAGVMAAAIARGATTDRRELGASLERTRLFRCVMAPLGGTETLVLVPTFSGRCLGMIALGRRGGKFSDAAVTHARSLVPVLSLASRAVLAPQGAGAVVTDAESDLLDYLELGLSTKEMAHARGTSFFTVRNQLAALYRKLGVSNRAEAIGRRYRRG